jgi:hypothetical protein
LDRRLSFAAMAFRIIGPLRTGGAKSADGPNEP